MDNPVEDVGLPITNKNDINEELLNNAEGIFKDALRTDSSTATNNSVSLPISNDETPIPDAKWFDEYGKKLLASSSPIMWEYHKSEIDNVNKIIQDILTTTRWVSFATILIATVCIFFDKNSGAIISGVIGGVIDAIFGILTGVFNSTLKSKKSYFDSENDSTKFNQMLLLVQTIADQNKKDSVIVDILHGFFDIDGGQKKN